MSNTEQKKALADVQRGDRIELTIKGTVDWASESYVAVTVNDAGGSISLTRADANLCEVVIKPAMPKWRDGDVVIGYDAAMMNDGAFRRHDGRWRNELAKGRDVGCTDSWIEQNIDEHGFRALVAEGRPVLPETAPEGEVPHDFAAGVLGDDDRCFHSDANGTCNMPEADPIHHGGK